MAEELLHKHFAPYQPKAGEDYMSAKQLTHFRKILETLKKELSEDIDRTVHTMQDEATVFADPNDRASQETDMAIELRNRLHSQFGGAFTINATAVFDYPTIGGLAEYLVAQLPDAAGETEAESPPETPTEPEESDVAGPPARGTTPLAEPGEQGAESSD